MAVGELVLVYGLVLVSGAVAYYLARTHSPADVLTGFVVGGLVFGVGVVVLGETLYYFFARDLLFGRSAVGYVFEVVTLGGRLVGGALVGVLCAKIGEKYR
jgi:hypothetical protein